MINISNMTSIPKLQDQIEFKDLYALDDLIDCQLHLKFDYGVYCRETNKILEDSSVLTTVINFFNSKLKKEHFSKVFNRYVFITHKGLKSNLKNSKTNTFFSRLITELFQLKYNQLITNDYQQSRIKQHRFEFLNTKRLTTFEKIAKFPIIGSVEEIKFSKTTANAFLSGFDILDLIISSFASRLIIGFPSIEQYNLLRLIIDQDCFQCENPLDFRNFLQEKEDIMNIIKQIYSVDHKC